ncbi:MAG: hypothetical protein QNK24_14070 [Desulfuromusa sp.]|nr:hypothetical protein [Desulfuromusa sp.]
MHHPKHQKYNGSTPILIARRSPPTLPENATEEELILHSRLDSLDWKNPEKLRAALLEKRRIWNETSHS